MIVAATGHRANGIVEDFRSVLIKAQVKLRYGKATRLICGMASGFDLLAAEAAMELGLPITAARPWAKHNAGAAWREHYAKTLEYADTIHIVHEEFAEPRNHGEAAKWLHDRNHWMVDNADAVMAYWDGKKEGGTYECRQYAKKVGRPIANIFSDPPF